MVNALLMAALLMATGRTGPGDKKDPHATLACAQCHNGRSAEKGRASVPRTACTASGCHSDAGPQEVTMANARFEHRNHGVGKQAVALGCGGCHTHKDGKEKLRASLDACALCHFKQVQGAKADDCRLCHEKSKHVGMTSQGIPIAHAELPWMETGCARCHYDVAGTRKKVSLEKCSSCHAKTPDLTKRGIASDLHPSHMGVNCTSCHEAGLHKIGALSSAVDLQCADCHTVAHTKQVKTYSSTCSSCHTTVHSAQQRLVLGFVGNEPVLPSAKFLMGLTCRSCHVPPGSTPVVSARKGQAAACAACHEPEFEKVLGWWLQGVNDRQRATSDYVAAAQRDLASGPAESRRLLTSSASALSLVRTAGGQHNLELSDLIFRNAVENAAKAYKLAGRAAPQPPALGNVPHVGTCSFCHYSTTDRWNYAGVHPGLHERLLRTKK